MKRIIAKCIIGAFALAFIITIALLCPIFFFLMVAVIIAFCSLVWASMVLWPINEKEIER